MTFVRRGVLAATLFASTGCVAVLTPAATTYPVTADVDFGQLAQMKRGESCATTVLHIFGPKGNASVAAAALAGGLRQVRYVDNRYVNNVLWQKYCVVAYGE